MKEGDLGDAVRASMSFPFMFKPIEIDNVLKYTMEVSIITFPRTS